MKLLLLLITNCILIAYSYGYAYEEYEEDLVDARLSLISQDEDKNCTKPGLLCKNCRILVQCIQVEEGQFEEIELEECTSDKTCLVNQCTTEPNPNCMDPVITEFKCTGTAMFPDPFDCKKYHFCSKKTDTNLEGAEIHAILECKGNYGYDPVSTFCKNKLTAGCPGFPVPICTKVGQTGALINKSLYYICRRHDGNNLYPELHVCQNGKIYENYVCK